MRLLWLSLITLCIFEEDYLGTWVVAVTNSGVGENMYRVVVAAQNLQTLRNGILSFLACNVPVKQLSDSPGLCKVFGWLEVQPARVLVGTARQACADTHEESTSVPIISFVKRSPSSPL